MKKYNLTLFIGVFLLFVITSCQSHSGSINDNSDSSARAIKESSYDTMGVNPRDSIGSGAGTGISPGGTGTNTGGATNGTATGNGANGTGASGTTNGTTTGAGTNNGATNNGTGNGNGTKKPR